MGGFEKRASARTRVAALCAVVLLVVVACGQQKGGSDEFGGGTGDDSGFGTVSGFGTAGGDASTGGGVGTAGAGNDTPGVDWQAGTAGTAGGWTFEADPEGNVDPDGSGPLQSLNSLFSFLKKPVKGLSLPDIIIKALQRTPEGKQFLENLVCPGLRSDYSAVNAAFAWGAYEGLFQRIPTRAEITSVSRRLAGGTSREHLALELGDSQEGRRTLVENLYTQLLGRSAEEGGQDYWQRRYSADSKGIEHLISEIAGSDEYFNRNGQSVPGFVNGMYRDILGRGVDQGGRDYFYPLIQNNGRLLAAQQITESEEGIRRQINGYYRAYLGRDADGGGSNYWLAIQRQQDLRAVRAGILGSAEANSRQTNVRAAEFNKLCAD